MHGFKNQTGPTSLTDLAGNQVPVRFGKNALNRPKSIKNM